MNDRERAEWIEGVIAGYEGPLIRYATHLCGRAETARDVVQDTFYKLCEADPAAVAEHVGAWLYRVCRNRVIDLSRRDRTMRPLDDAKLAATASADPLPAVSLEREQSSALVVRLLTRLPERQQEVVRLKFQEGLSYREIASVTGQSVTNVGFLIHGALRKLRELWAEVEPGARIPPAPVRSMP
jgi:RNA polymerase sigma-70 factor (ECF subfamily)